MFNTSRSNRDREDRHGVVRSRGRIPVLGVLSVQLIILLLQPLQAGLSSVQEENEQAATLAKTGENDPAAQLFGNRCSGCHTIGGGPLAGPDLLPSTQWPGPDLEQATRRMQQNVGPLTEEQIQTLVDFMKSDDVRDRVEQQKRRFESQAVSSREEEGSTAVGRQLFFGGRSLANGGTACMACHQVTGAGGTLAVNLTDVSQRLGRMPLVSGIRQSGYPVMNAVYRDHPITAPEALHLATFLESIGEGSEAADEGGVVELYYFSGVLAIVLLVSLPYFYRNRNPGFRRRLVEEGSRRRRAMK